MEETKLLSLKFEQFKTFHLEQANHNYLFSWQVYSGSKNQSDNTRKFYDWVITAAFYSALHYVRCALSIDKEFIFYKNIFTNKTVEEVRRIRLNKPNDFPKDAASGRHEILKQIAQETYPAVSVAYNMLFDKSITSRYNQFKNATEDECSFTLDLLDEVRDWFSQKTKILLPENSSPGTSATNQE